MAESVETRRNGAEAHAHGDGQVGGTHSGQYGVSDKRRAELARMEQDAGVQHEAADESVTQRPDTRPRQTGNLNNNSGSSDTAAARPGDRH